MSRCHTFLLLAFQIESFNTSGLTCLVHSPQVAYLAELAGTDHRGQCGRGTSLLQVLSDPMHDRVK